MTLLLRQCKICKQEKPSEDFYVSNRVTCKPCYIERVLKNQQANPELYQSLKLEYKYGITLAERDQMIEDQNNRCACCNDEFEKSLYTHVDHCHTTLKIRGILCHNCNKGLGNFKDSTDRLAKAIKYLEQDAQENTTTPVPTGPNTEGQEHSQHGTILATGFGENDDHTDDHSGAVRGQDADHRAQASSGDSVGYRSKEVESSIVAKSIEATWPREPTAIWVSPRSGHLLD